MYSLRLANKNTLYIVKNSGEATVSHPVHQGTAVLRYHILTGPGLPVGQIAPCCADATPTEIMLLIEVRQTLNPCTLL